MAHNLPQFIAFKSALSGRYAYFMTENDDVRGYVRCSEYNVHRYIVKIEVETAQIGSKFVHLRFCHNNRYWARRGPGPDDRWILGSSNQPEEDTSKLSCTLFEPTIGTDGFLYLNHVQSGGRLRTNVYSEEPYIGDRLFVDDKDYGVGHKYYAFSYVDWDTLVIMPKHVAFKGDNEKFLRDLWHDSHPYLQFSSNDGNDQYASFEVTMHPDGHIRIKSDNYGKFWRRSPNWIWSDSTDAHGSDKETLFWPVKVNDNTIALRNAGNNKFCLRLTTEGKTDCLNASGSKITPESKLIVEELVLERNIYNVRYRLEDARIFDEKPFLAGIGSAINESNQQSSLTIKVSYEITRSYSFTSNLSIMAGVKTTIQTGFARIVEGKIEISAEITTSFEWSRTTQETITAEASYTVIVPPKSRVRVNYVATEGTCSVPFSYTQKDKLSGDGSLVTSQHTDGVYTGVDYYNFNFEEPEVEPVY